MTWRCKIMRTTPKLMIICGVIIVLLSFTVFSMQQNNTNNTTNNTTNETNITLNANNTTNNTTDTTTQTKKSTQKTSNSQKKSGSDTVYTTDNPEDSGEYEGVGEAIYRNKKTGKIYTQTGQGKLQRSPDLDYYNYPSE